MDDFKQLMTEAVEAATGGDLEALWIAELLLSHLRQQLAPGSCTA